MTQAHYEHLINLEAYEEGADAAEGGLAVIANPYKPDTEEHEAWALAWRETDDHLTHEDDPGQDYLTEGDHLNYEPRD